LCFAQQKKGTTYYYYYYYYKNYCKAKKKHWELTPPTHLNAAVHPSCVKVFKVSAKRCITLSQRSKKKDKSKVRCTSYLNVYKKLHTQQEIVKLCQLVSLLLLLLDMAAIWEVVSKNPNGLS
jgi:hypothetical protein